MTIPAKSVFLFLCLLVVLAVGGLLLRLLADLLTPIRPVVLPPCSKTGGAHIATELRVVGFDSRSNYLELRCECGLVTHMMSPCHWMYPTWVPSHSLKSDKAEGK